MADQEPIDELIQRSSFGTPAVRSLADRTSDEDARRIAERVRDRPGDPPGRPARRHYRPTVEPPAWAEQIAAVLGRTELFAELDHAARCALAVRARLESVLVDKEQSVYTKGDLAKGMFVLAKGMVKVEPAPPMTVANTSVFLSWSRALEASGETELVRAPAVFGEAELFTGGQRLASVQVVEPATVIAIPRDELFNLLEANHHVALAMMRRLGRLLRDATQWRNQVVHQQFCQPTPWSRVLWSTLAPQRFHYVSPFGESEENSLPTSQSVLALDIEGFGRMDRTNTARLDLRAALHDTLTYSLMNAEIAPTDVADFGDGAVVLVDPQVPKPRLLTDFVRALAAALANHNRHLRPEARLRLRLAVHSGEAVWDAHGDAGKDLELAFRLLNARELRNRFARGTEDLALIVSEAVVDDVMAQPHHGVDLAGGQLVKVRAKETTAKAWVLPQSAIEPKGGVGMQTRPAPC